MATAPPSWDDVRWLAESWNGPLIVKGVLSAEDARRARDAGAHAIMISNHGGRQLDGTPAPVECVAAMRDAVGDTLQLIVDGGVRRGTHVLKALALGADAVSFGRGTYASRSAMLGGSGIELVTVRERHVSPGPAVHLAADGDGDTLAGPLVLSLPETTVWIAPGWTGHHDATGTLVLEADR